MKPASLDALANHFGIHHSYCDFNGETIVTTQDTKLALLRANGLQLDNEAMVDEALEAFVKPEQDRWFPRELIVSAEFDYVCHFGLGAAWHILLDPSLGEEKRDAVDAKTLKGVADTHITLPPLPAGVHELVIEVAGRCEHTLVIATPIKAPSIQSLCGKERVWGLNAALFALQSERNSGLGDFEDLARLAEHVAGLGGSFVGVNPVHNLGFSDPISISPYSPSHRGFFNNQHIALDSIPAIAHLPQTASVLEGIAIQADELRKTNQLDHLGHRICHNAALRDLYTLFLQYADSQSRDQFANYVKARGNNLTRFATFEALSEQYGPDWHDWPVAMHQCSEALLQEAQGRYSARIDFYKWLQWVASEQLAQTQQRAKGNGAGGGQGLGLYLDLAVGARQSGAESWCEAQSVAKGVSLGAPPDQLGPDGQNWGLMAYAPKRLAEDHYKSLRHIYRASMRHAGILRIDHVLGLNRSFWIPDDGSPGAYVSQPLDSLLAILAIEAEASQTAVIGEDLGLVPDGFREKVAARGIYGYSVLQYEKKPDGAFKGPDEWRTFSLACFSTHDTPTLKGYAAGRDLDWWLKLGSNDEEATNLAKAQRERDVEALAAFTTQQDEQEKIDAKSGLFHAVHSSLAASSVSMISVQLDDILDLSEAQNLPGTIDEHPNWRRRTPVTIENLPCVEKFSEIERIMKDAGRSL